MDLNAVVTTIDNYNNDGNIIFDDFDFTMEFLNTIRFCGDEDYIAVAFVKYLIELFDGDFAKVDVYKQYAIACEIIEKPTSGINVIETISEGELDYDSEFNGDYRRVIKHVPTGRFMVHTAYTGSYNDGYDMCTHWVEAFQKERVVIYYDS